MEQDSAPETRAALVDEVLRWCPDARAAMLAAAVAAGGAPTLRRWIADAGDLYRPADVFKQFFASPGSRIHAALVRARERNTGMAENTTPGDVACVLGDVDSLALLFDAVAPDPRLADELESLADCAVRSGRVAVVEAFGRIARRLLGVRAEDAPPLETRLLGTCSTEIIRAVAATGVVAANEDNMAAVDALRRRDDDGRATVEKLRALFAAGVSPVCTFRRLAFTNSHHCAFAFLAAADDTAGLALYLEAARGLFPDRVDFAESVHARRVLEWARAHAPAGLFPHALTIAPPVAMRRG